MIWSLIAAFALCAIASFLLRHLSTGQTLALFAFAFLEMLIIRTIARMDYMADSFETFSPSEE